MKKVLSLILSICMLGAFAFSANAAAVYPTSIKLDVTETETGASVDVVLAGEFSEFNDLTLFMQYDNTKLKYESVSFRDSAASWTAKYASEGKIAEGTLPDGYIKFKYGTEDITGNDYLSDKDLKIATLEFSKVGDAKLADGDVKSVDKVKVGRNYKNTELFCSGAKWDAVAFSTTFTAYTPDEPDKPSFVIPEDSEKTGENSGIVDINTNAETGAYSVKVTAPIGKKAVIYIDGVATSGSAISGTATKATTIKVAYEDVTDEVITYVVPMSSIYGAEDGIAAFGKGTIAEGVEYGIKFGGLTGTYKGITDYKFPAKGNVGGIFGVEVKDAPAGNYTAQAYVGDAMGAAIDFTK